MLYERTRNSPHKFYSSIYFRNFALARCKMVASVLSLMPDCIDMS